MISIQLSVKKEEKEKVMIKKYLLILIGHTFLLFAVLGGCGTLPKPEEGKEAFLEVPFVKQEKWYCGAAAISAYSQFYGRFISQYEVACNLFSRKRSGIINIHVNMFMREKGFWTKTLVLSNYTTIKEKDKRLKDLLKELKQYLDRGHPVIALMGPPTKTVLGLSVRIFLGPIFYVSDYEDITRLNHYVILIGYDDKSKVFIMHDGIKPGVSMSYRTFIERWEKVDCWALVAVPPQKINWELTPEEMLDAGYILEQYEKYREALKYYTAALEKSSMLKDEERKKELEFRILFNTANAHLSLRNYDEAEKTLKKLKSISGDTGPLLNNLAEVYLKKGIETEKAQAMVVKALSKDSANKVYYYDTLAMILFHKGEIDKACKLLESAIKAVTHKDVLSVLHYHMGKIFESQKEFEKAFYHFSKAADNVDEEMHPKRESEYTLRYALCGLKIGKEDKAVEGLYKVIALDRGAFSLEARDNLIKVRDKGKGTRDEEPGKVGGQQ
ncbi:C39 family peptidase [Planctomycetota bacterium]